MNKILLITVLSVLVGCGDKEVRHAEVRVWTKCINGVVYYSGFRRLAPAYNRNGTLKLCEVGR